MKRAGVVGAALLLSGAVTGAYITGRVSAQRALVTPDEINTVEVAQKAVQAVVRIDNRLQREQLQAGDDPVETGTGSLIFTCNSFTELRNTRMSGPR